MNCILAEHNVRLIPDEMSPICSGRGLTSVRADVIAKVLVLLTTISCWPSRDPAAGSVGG